MSKKNSTKFVTRDILKSSLEGAFQKLDPRYMIKNPVMFVVEAGCLVTLLLTVFPTLFEKPNISFITELSPEFCSSQSCLLILPSQWQRDGEKPRRLP